jgi:hypothetical protein
VMDGTEWGPDCVYRRVHNMIHGTSAVPHHCYFQAFARNGWQYFSFTCLLCYHHMLCLLRRRSSLTV